MEISRLPAAQRTTNSNQPTVRSLAAGTVFKIGTKLFLKTNASGAPTIRLTSGAAESVDGYSRVTEVVKGAFKYE